jgi:hypothetical protein
MKKLLTLMLALALTLTLSACSGGSDTSTTTPSGGNSTTPPTSSDNATSETTTPGNSSTTTPPSSSEEWPDNDFTKQISNPGWDSLYKTAEIPDMMFSANYRTVSAQQAKEYAEKLKNEGFDTDISVNEADVLYSFGAKNADGYSVGITLAMEKGETSGELLLTVSKV